MEQKTPHQIAQDIVDQRLRAMSPTEKMHAAMRLYHSARQLKAAWIQKQNPSLSEEEVQKLVKEAFMYART